jgi:hypothetical protein
MRQLLRELAACGLLLATFPIGATAQQGSIKISAAAHSIQGDPSRLGTQAGFEPDLGVSWLRPGSRFGVFQMEIRGTARDGEPHFGRTFVSLRDLKHHGITYTFDAGDSFFSPSRGEHQQRNLYTPAINFSGVAAKATTTRSEVAVMLGKATTTRDMLGTDIDTLDQGLFIARGSHKASDRLEISARASRIRTRDLKEFTFTIASSDQAGSGARFVLTPALHLVADASVVTYRRRNSSDQETDGSALAGASVLLARGWLQVNASRFSPGELPILTQPLADRQTLYAAGEYEVFRRMRAFGGWESFRSNLDRSPASVTPTDGGRAFGGLRVPLGASSSASFRVESGDRRSRLVGAALTRVSDTGVVSGELQSTFGPVSTFLRFGRRENVESESASGSYTQRESSGIAFINMNRALQIFTSVNAVFSSSLDGGGHTFWQIGGGTQAQLFNRGLWLRGEGLFSHNLDLLSDRSRPQQTLNVGLNGEIARNTVLGFHMYADRMAANQVAEPWLIRSTLRVTRTFVTTSSAPSRTVLGSMARHGGTGSLVGIVYSDWNANGMQDPGELPLQNIPIRLSNLGNASTSRTGEFAFVNIPIGLQQIGIDMSSLPVDFDGPQVPQVQVELARGQTERLAFGLVPLGSIAGRVMHDVNGNGTADDGDRPLDDAVLVLNGGTRSEKVRDGQFRFDAVRSGEHTLALLQESLPEGATILGSPSITVTIGRESIAPETAFLVSIQTRPEIRRVFPGPGGQAAAPSAPAASTIAVPPGGTTSPRAGRTAASDPVPPRAREAAAASRGSQQFAIQIAALSDRSRAARLVEQLRAGGYSAYLVEPPSGDTTSPYKVRVGFYDTRAAAEEQARIIGKARGEKLWVVRER